MGESKDTCAFRCLTIEERAPLPTQWLGRYGVGLVRRGVLIRQRVDQHGQARAIDAAGPGCLVPFQDAGSASTPAGYAATRLLICLCPTEILDEALGSGDGSALDLIRMQREALERIERITDARGRPRTEARVAALLCTLSDTLSPPRRRRRIPHGLQQRDLAALLGVRHESVCRALGQLEARGAVAREPDGLRIVDRDALEAA